MDKEMRQLSENNATLQNELTKHKVQTGMCIHGNHGNQQVTMDSNQGYSLIINRCNLLAISSTT